MTELIADSDNFTNSSVESNYHLLVNDSPSVPYINPNSKTENVLGYMGNWTFFDPMSSDKEAVTSSFKCMRTYEVSGSTPFLVTFRTLHDKEPQNCKAHCRDDGLFECSHSRRETDAFFSSSVNLSGDTQDYLPPYASWRTLDIDSNCAVHFAPCLPHLKHIKNSAQLPAGVFAFEAFIKFGSARLSLGGIYSVANESLISHYVIKESQVQINLKKPIDFENFGIEDEGEKLSSNVSSWMNQGSFEGEMAELIWDEDGELIRLPTRPAVWTPPDPLSKTHRLYLYNNGAYAYYPMRLTYNNATSDNEIFDSGTRFELGSFTRTDEFVRIIFKYSASGLMVSLTRELFKLNGSFEYSRRSTTVRQSFSQSRKKLS